MLNTQISNGTILVGYIFWCKGVDPGFGDCIESLHNARNVVQSVPFGNFYVVLRTSVEPLKADQPCTFLLGSPT
ncbi:hypothetical protein NSE_0731 [Neorickettsia sennetsu str. Miyayama]|uniref:Uncharacterized protein n=1 Tax=Ehrlichia sennetsu (strain ATCC VR-367 / Miyayama) TaxID=222891 RepID=Q2GD39_EHRS3|nr:hypothetical protein NSE_0731 [Neorickettsia sennetsu str. Miyayama]